MNFQLIEYIQCYFRIVLDKNIAYLQSMVPLYIENKQCIHQIRMLVRALQTISKKAVRLRFAVITQKYLHIGVVLQRSFSTGRGVKRL